MVDSGESGIFERTRYNSGSMILLMAHQSGLLLERRMVLAGCWVARLTCKLANPYGFLTVRAVQHWDAMRLRVTLENPFLCACKNNYVHNFGMPTKHTVQRGYKAQGISANLLGACDVSEATPTTSWRSPLPAAKYSARTRLSLLNGRKLL